jgi:hypothetical protein
LRLSLFDPKNSGVEILFDKIQQLSPKDEPQRQLKGQALTLASTVGQTRWLMYEQRSHSVSPPMLAVVVFWLMAIFISFGLSAPRERHGCGQLGDLSFVGLRRNPINAGNVYALCRTDSHLERPAPRGFCESRPIASAVP